MPRDTTDPRIFVSYSRSDGEAFARDLRKKLAAQGFSLWHDRQDMEGGRDWWRQITEAIDTVEYLVLVVTPAVLQSEAVHREWRYARQHGRCVVPVMGKKALDFSSLPRWMASSHFYDLDIPEQKKRFIRQLESPCTTPRVPMMAPQPPADFVRRPDEFAPLKAALLDTRGEPVAITSALRGAGGYGKTTLAKALCADDAIQDAFHDGILWVTLGENAGEPQGRIEDLIHVLQGRRENFGTRDAALARLAELLADRRCLLVIDDVWHPGDAEPFLQAGPRCARLLTTRNADTLPADAVEIRVDELRAEQAVELLQKGLPPADPAKLRHLSARLGEWPLLLKLVNGVLRDRVGKLRSPLPDAVAHVERLFDKRGLTAFDAANAVERNAAVAKTLNLSLDMLVHGLRDRLAELAIFPEDARIPIEVINNLWHETGGLDDIDTDAALQRFFDLSLLLDLDLTEHRVRLHDIVRSWLRVRMSFNKLSELDQALVAAFRTRCCGIWHNSPNDGYTLQYLCVHLRSVDLIAWRALLLSSHWMMRKLTTLGVTALIVDYEDTSEEDFRAIGGALRLSAHVLAKDPSQLPSQIRGRLGGSRESTHIQLVRDLEQNINNLSMLPRFASLTPPGGPLIRTLTGHSKWINSISITSDSKYLASASQDTTIKIWELASGAESGILRGHTREVTCAVVTPDGLYVVSASQDRTVKIWDIVKSSEVRTLEGHQGWVTSVALTPDCRHIVSASEDRTIRVWDFASGDMLLTLSGHEREVSAVTISCDGSRVVSASGDRTLRVWDLTSGTLLQTLRGHDFGVRALALTPDGKRAVSASTDETLKVWDLESGLELRTLRGHGGWVTAVAVAPNGRTLVSGSTDRSIRLWNLDTGVEVRTLTGHGGMITALSITLDGSLVISASDDCTIKLWDLVNEAKTASSQRHGSWVIGIANTPDCRHAITASQDKTIKVWDLASGESSRTIQGHLGWVGAVTVTADGHHIISASQDRKIKIWDFHTGMELRELSGHRSWVTAVAVTANPLYIVSGSDDRTIKIWNFLTGVEMHTLRGHAGRIMALAVTQDGERVISAAQDQLLKIWSLKSLSELWTLQGHDGWVMAVAVTHDGRYAVSASWDKTLKVWDMATGTEQRTLRGHGNAVTGVAITPDSRYVLSSSYDRTIRAWELATGENVATMTGDQSMYCIAAVSDWLFVVGDRGGTVHIVDLIKPRANVIVS